MSVLVRLTAPVADSSASSALAAMGIVTVTGVVRSTTVTTNVSLAVSTPSLTVSVMVTVPL